MSKTAVRTAKTALLMVFVTLAAKALGLVRNTLLAQNFGTTADAVAYETASRLPLTLFDFALGGVVTAAFIPVFNELLVKEGRDRALSYANKYFNLILLITVAISAIGMLFSKQLVSFLAPEATEAVKALASRLSRIMFPMIIFTGIAYCYVGILQSFEKYTLPAVMSLVSNLVMVVYFYTFCDSFGVFGLSAALLIGWFLQAAIQAPAAHKLGFRYKPTLDFKDGCILRSLKMAVPILVCSWLQPVCNVINTRFASGYEGGGAISMVNYANQLYIIIVGVFSFVATNLLFPKLSRSEAEGDRDGVRRFAASSMKILLYIMIPIAAGVFILADPIVRLFYMRGAFTAHDAELTADVLRLFAIGIPFMSANEVLTKVFFAIQKVKAPMMASVLSIGINILLVCVLVNTVGFDGIALASSVTIAICTCINYLLLSKNGALLDKNDAWDIIKTLLATAVMTALVYFADKLPLASDFLKIALCGASGLIIYAVCMLVFSPTEIKKLIRKGKK